MISLMIACYKNLLTLRKKEEMSGYALIHLQNFWTVPLRYMFILYYKQRILSSWNSYCNIKGECVS